MPFGLLTLLAAPMVKNPFQAQTQVQNEIGTTSFKLIDFILLDLFFSITKIN